MFRLRRIAPRGLFWRSLLIVLGPLILLQGVVAYIFFERHWDTVSRQLALGISGDVVTVMRYLREHPEPELHAWMIRAARAEMQLAVVFEDGAILPNDAPRRSDRIMDRMLHEAIGQRIFNPFQIDTRRPDEQISIRIQHPNGVLTMLTPERRMRSSTTYLFVLWMVGTAIVVTALAVFFLRNQMRPIRRLAAAADALGKGRPVTDLKPTGALEIRRATSAFIGMQERIRRQITQRTEMLAGVSHDLRTPLTRMKLQLAMLGSTHPESDAEIAEFERDIAQMERMIDEYLAFARGQGTENPVSADLAEIVSEVADGARRKGGQIALEVEQPLVVPLRPNAIKRCLTNLVENAARYGAQIEISAMRRNGIVEITIEDDGPGIPEDQREAVFKPFFRLDGARSPNTGGAGLGLAIARDVARGHGGDIRMTSGALGGLRAELWLPV